MSKRKKHFFEVYSGLATTQPLDPITRSAPSPGATAVSGPAAPAARSRYLTFRVTRETVVILGVLFSGLMFVAFFWGYHRGAASYFDGVASGAKPEKKATAERPVLAGISKPRQTLNVADDSRASGPRTFYSLCVWTGNSRQGAWDLAKSLRTPKHEAYVVQLRNTRGYLVTVGRFSSTKSREATQLKKTFQEKIYKGQRPFQSCYWRPVKQKAS